MVNKSNYKKCYLYILDTLSDWEIAFITAELNSQRYFTKNINLDFILIGNTLDPIKTMGGISITPAKDINNIDFQEGDLLILPGADTWMDQKNKNILEIVSDIINKKVTIAAICGATLALAQAGLLDNKNHTSNAKDFLKMFCPNYAGASHYINSPAVQDDYLITASGLAPLEFSYEIFKNLNVMKNDSLEAWYQLYKTKDSKYFYSLMDSLK